MIEKSCHHCFMEVMFVGFFPESTVICLEVIVQSSHLSSSLMAKLVGETLFFSPTSILLTPFRAKLRHCEMNVDLSLRALGNGSRHR